jgi:hypothetical protein
LALNKQSKEVPALTPFSLESLVLYSWTSGSVNRTRTSALQKLTTVNDGHISNRTSKFKCSKHKEPYAMDIWYGCYFPSCAKFGRALNAKRNFALRYSQAKWLHLLENEF